MVACYLRALVADGFVGRVEILEQYPVTNVLRSKDSVLEDEAVGPS